MLLAGSGVVLQQAVESFREYLDQAMGVQAAVDLREAAADLADRKRVIVVASATQLPGCGPALKGPKDYRLLVTADRILVCGFDERGAMYGLYNLQARMSLREAPILPRQLDVARHSLYRTRMTLSGLGWMDFPDAYLSMLSRYGFDAIYASDYAQPTGAPPPPLYSYMRQQDPDRLRDLIARAARYGIRVYCPIVYQIKGDARDDTELRELIRDTVARFPGIGGYILLIEGFFYRELPQWTWTEQQTRAWIAQWMRGVEIAVDEFHKIDPAIEVIPWDYNVDYRPSAVGLKRAVIAQYPATVIPIVTWENGKGFSRDGEQGYLKDYAISEVGPSEVAAAQIAQARKRGMQVYVKADAWASWQFGTFPYLPVPQQWLRRYRALAGQEIDGTLESWTYGLQPNFVAELRAWYAWSDAPDEEELLAAFARRDFGSDAVRLVRSAWEHFSKAIAFIPDTGPDMGTNNAIGAPLFLERPEPRAMTLDHSWALPVLGPGGGLNVSPYWPYAPRRLILEPDFTNRTNRAEEYAQPFSLAVFTKYLLQAADEMERGLADYRRAAAQAKPSQRLGAYREVLLAEQLQRMMRSEQAILEFEDLRFRLAGSAPAEQRDRMLDRMENILNQEIARTEASLAAALRDSRLGYEWEQDYVYTPRSLREKLRQLHEGLEVDIPRQRRLTSEVPPTPAIRGPAQPISTASWSQFTFRSEGAASFECRLEGEPFGGCQSPHRIAALADGLHTMSVRARNAAGILSATARYSWTIDSRPPDAIVTSGPKQPATNDRNAMFEFRASKPAVAFECRLAEERDFRSCSSGNVLPNLADGTHTLLVNAIDAMGRASLEPAQYTWTVDTVPPSGTSIISGPTQPVSDEARATFRFASSDPQDTFECKLSVEPEFGPCPNPHSIPFLPNGRYTLIARARDEAGNVDPSPAAYTWSINAAATKQ
jgi:hypothetical protein